MKKVVLLLVVLMCGITSFAQNKSLYSKRFHGEPTENVKPQSPQWHLDNFSRLSKRSGNYQYGALGCMAASIGCFIGYSTLDTKYTYTVKRGEVTDKKMRVCAKNYLIGGSVLAAAAIVCEALSINCRIKADKSLRIYSTGNGAGLSYNF